jgi:hypothetical protein
MTSMPHIANGLDRFGSGLIYAHHSIVVAVGAFGIIEAPSPAVASIVGGLFAAYVWSAMFVVFGVLALGCRVANRHGIRWAGKLYRLDTTRSEALCIALIGVAMFLFAGLITGATLFGDQLEQLPPSPNDDRIPGEPGSIQTALALLSSSVFLPGVAAISMAQTRLERIRGGTLQHHVLTELAQEARRTTEEN